MKKTYTLLLACLFAAPSVARAHSKLDQPPPVNTSDANKNPAGPCGTIPATPVQTQFTANGNLTISWFETVNHVGAFELRFAENGPNDCTLTNNGGTVEPTSAQTQNAANKVCPTLLTPAIPDPDDAGINEADPTTWKKYTKTVKMPNSTCTNCIVQLVQWMGSGTGAAKTFTPYYSCARVTTQTPPPIPDMAGSMPDLATGAGGGGGGGGGGSGGGGGGGGDNTPPADMAVGGGANGSGVGGIGCSAAVGNAPSSARGPAAVAAMLLAMFAVGAARRARRAVRAAGARGHRSYRAPR